jgi:hypothetical protein
MENKQYHTIGTFLEFNGKTIERGKKMALPGSDDVTRFTTVYNSHIKMNLLK